MGKKLQKPIAENSLFDKVAELVTIARQKTATAVNLAMVHTYFEIGKLIIENEQRGEQRAEYGKQVLKELSQRLTDNFGKGFSVENLDRMRFFYKTYSIPNSSTPLTNFSLSWSHYLILMRIKNADERRFYEIEATASSWSLRELERQFDSSLYERLALSRDKDKVKALSQTGQTLENSIDLIKNPLVLEFLGLREETWYSETDLETRIINGLQNFMLELGKGFSFVGRQVRFSFDEQHFKVDLVFYNRLLQCFVLVDLKIGKLTHQDLGQMQMYVNYYDRRERLPHEKPTVGILLCRDKNDSLVELTLPKEANIHAAEYSLYLPDKKLLREKLNELSAPSL